MRASGRGRETESHPVVAIDHRAHDFPPVTANRDDHVVGRTPLPWCPENSWRLNDTCQTMTARVRDGMKGKRTFDAHTPVSINASGPSSSHILLRYSRSMHPKTSGRARPGSLGGVEGAHSESVDQRLSSLSCKPSVVQLGYSTSGSPF